VSYAASQNCNRRRVEQPLPRIFQLLAEGQSEARKPLYMQSGGRIQPLNIARRNQLHVRAASDRPTHLVSNTYFLFRYIIRQPSIRILLYCQQAGLMSFVNASGE